MQITPTAQPPRVQNLDLGNSPQIELPVLARLSCPVFYDTGEGLKPMVSPILCARQFANSVLLALEQKCVKYGYGLVHIGVLAQRPARHANGTLIKPIRWTNHAYGRAIDWKGLVLPGGEFQDMLALRRESPGALAEILDHITHSMRAVGIPDTRQEMVKEPNWHHCGFYD